MLPKSSSSACSSARRFVSTSPSFHHIDGDDDNIDGDDDNIDGDDHVVSVPLS